MSPENGSPSITSQGQSHNHTTTPTKSSSSTTTFSWEQPPTAIFFLTLSLCLLPSICGFFLILFHILTITGGTPRSFTTLARSAQSFGNETTRREIHASLLMACSSAGFTLLVTGLTLARMGPVATDEYVSSLTCRISSGFFPSKVLGIMGRSSHTITHLFDSLLTRICLKVTTRKGGGS